VAPVSSPVSPAPTEIVLRAAPPTLLEEARDIWAYRDLLYFLVWRDLKVRYRQTLLGLFWVLVQPLGTMIVFALLLGRVAALGTGGVPYPIYVYAGLWPWTVLGAAILSSAGSIVSNGHLVTKVYFPRAIVPAAAVLGRLVDLLVGLPLALLLCRIYGVELTWRVLTLPVWAALLLLLGLGAGLLLSSMAVRYRDLLHALPFALQLGLLAAPILYPLDAIAGRARYILLANPVTGLVQGFRWALTASPLPRPVFFITLFSTLLLLVLGIRSFRAASRRFADLV
jgi:lipopolysaccharide transport system permease protein